MDIQVDTVRIYGFRGLSNIEIELPRITVLLGQNNSGKTSVIKALQLALGDYHRYLSDEDFYIGEDEKRRESITVDLRFIAAIADKRLSEFSENWLQEFGDLIQQEANGDQFVAIRTVATPDKVKGGYSIERFYLDSWPALSNWQTERTKEKNKLKKRFESIPFISIDAQRDIHNELKEKSSFVGRVLSSIKFNEKDVVELEKKIAKINKEAIEKCESLKLLKASLDSLSRSFEGSGKTELTPFPKKIRDIPTRFSVHFGESDTCSFSMEYHGMGTRSWASMLTVKAFVELMAKNYEEDARPFFPILAAEEPEAHLHPNAQRTLCQQLQNSIGQVIISTHSPYLAGSVELDSLRGLVKSSRTVIAARLVDGLDLEDKNTIKRQIMRLKGELLFSKALILFEGITEEQIVPAMFEKYFDTSPFTLGVNCISVSGNGYHPYIKMALSFGIPVGIISDNDQKIKDKIESQIKKITDSMPGYITDDNFYVSYLSDGNDFEAELLYGPKIREEINDALVMFQTRGSDNACYVAAKKKEVSALNTIELLDKMRSCKSSYAGCLADVISKNPNGKPIRDLIPAPVVSVFEKIKSWI